MVESTTDFTAQIAFQRLPDERLDLTSRKTRYQAELEKENRELANLADDLRLLADKAYPGLEEKARSETLALNAYLAQLKNSQVALCVKQKSPQTIE